MIERPFAILVAGEPTERARRQHGGYADIIRRAGRQPGRSWVDVDLRDLSPLPDPSTLIGVVVTGSSASVTERLPWMLRAEAYLRSIVHRRVPTLGICFGHQLLGQALGGEVVRNPRGREIGTVDLEIVENDPLLLTATAPLKVNATHVDTIHRLAKGARVLARTMLERHAAVRFSEVTWGVQFHPEMDSSMLREHLNVRRELLLQEGIDPDAVLERTTDARAGASTLVQFLDIAWSLRSDTRNRRV